MTYSSARDRFRRLADDVCGFVACVGPRFLQSGQFPKALASIECRGPDARSIAERSDAIFGHTRLAIIGLGTEGQQPVERDGNLLVFNGEIYNYKELAQQLGCPADSDVSVLYEMCVKGIDSWISKVRGMYAFVYYDSLKQEVTAARDPFGIKPLYYSESPEKDLLFTSTVAAMRMLLPSATYDHVSLVSFLASGVFAAGRTAFSEIRQLPAGELWSWNRAGEKWCLQQTRTTILSDWPVLGVEEAVTDSVLAHLVADVEVGVLLSGGVDSTLLAALSSRYVPELRTFSLTNPSNPSIDEGPIAQYNANLLGSMHTEVPVDAELLAAQVRPLLRSIGEPFSDAAYLPLSVLSAEVRRHVKVALAGEGADELFGGYRRYDAEKYMKGAVFSRIIHPLASQLRLDQRLSTSPGAAARYFAASALPTGWERHAALMFATWAEIRAAFPETGHEAWLDYMTTWQVSGKSDWALGLPPNRAYDLRVWLPEVFLQKSDRSSMAHGLELRTPYLDPVVATAAHGFNPRNSRKEPLRQALFHALPGVRLPKRKRGLAVNTASLCQIHFRPELDHILNSSESMLWELGISDLTDFKSSVARSPALEFRLAILSIWDSETSHH